MEKLNLQKMSNKTPNDIHKNSNSLLRYIVKTQVKKEKKEKIIKQIK